MIVVILALAIVASASVFFLNFNETIHHEYDLLSNEKLQTVAQSLEAVFDSIDQISRSLAHERQLIKILSKKQNDLSQQESLNISILISEYAWRLEYKGVRIDIDVVGKYGAKFSNSLPHSYTYDKLRNESWWIDFLGTTDRGLLISTTSQSNSYTFRYIRPIRSSIKQETLGALIFEISEKILYESYQGSQTRGQEIYLVDANENVVSSKDKTVIGCPFTEVTDHLNYESNRIAIQSRALRKNSWKVIEITPESLIQKQIEVYFQNYLKSMLLITVCILLIALVFAVRLTKPIRILNQDMRRVRDGDYTVRSNVRENNEIGMIAATFNEMTQSMNNMIESKMRQEKHRSDLEIGFLRAQINPHFIYNTLNGVRFLIDMGKREEASNMLLSFTKLLRHTLSVDSEQITLSRETESLENYIELQKIRYPGEFDFTNKITMEMNDYRIPAFLLQPVIENSIMYGTNSHYILKIELSAQILAEKHVLQLVVSDNGPGIDVETLNRINSDSSKDKMNSIGIQNIRQRIKAYCGSGFGIDVISTPGVGTKVVFNLPAIFKKD